MGSETRARKMTRWTYYLLIGVHGFLLAWAVVGFTEWLVPSVPWNEVTNPHFPRWLLFLHWSAILLGGGGFLSGYFFWRTGFRPVMAVAYSIMAVMCAIETFGYMTSETKYFAMAAEYVTYSGLLFFYFKTFRRV